MRIGLGVGLVIARKITPVLWTPDYISTAIWLDASDLSTITLNGSTVSQWNDKSGNNRHISQATAINQPTWLTTGNGTKPALQFGASATMTTGAFTVGNTSSIFGVIRPNSLGGANKDFITSAGTNGMAHILYHQNTVTNGLWLYSGVALSSSANAIAQGSWAIMCGITNGASSQIRSNGSSVAIGNAGTQVWSSGMRIGRAASASTNTIADYSEIVVAAGVLSDQNIARVEGYLAWKWGMQANLPTTHPYYYAPPLV